MPDHPVPARDLLSPLLRDLGRVPKLTAAAEQALGRRIRSGDRAARDTLIRSNIPLVIWVAKRYRRRGFDLDDLVGYGLTGLIRAVDLYDSEAGYKFSTYANRWIRQTIGRALDYESDLIHIPTGAEARPVEVIRPDQSDGISLAGLCTDHRFSGQCLLERRDELDHLLSHLDDRLRSVMVARHGLDGGPERTLREIGKLWGVSATIVQRWEDRAMMALMVAAGVSDGQMVSLALLPARSMLARRRVRCELDDTVFREAESLHGEVGAVTVAAIARRLKRPTTTIRDVATRLRRAGRWPWKARPGVVRGAALPRSPAMAAQC